MAKFQTQKNRTSIPVKILTCAPGNECFRWCHIRHLNPQEIHPERIKKCDKERIKNLDYTNVTFPVTQKDYRKIEIMNNININVFGYEKQEPYPVYISREKFNMLNLLLITKGKEHHYVLIKDFNKFMYNETKHKKENISVCTVCSVSIMKKPSLIIKKTALQLMVHRL